MPVTPPPLGRRIASRRYFWKPPGGRRRRVDVEIGTPRRVRGSDWGCRFRITGLPKRIDSTAYGIDAVQALQNALVGTAKNLSESPQFRAGQIGMFDAPGTDAAALFLPLPLNSLQGTLESLREFLERQQQKERKLKRGWFYEEWARALLTSMRNISGDLATLAARLPILPRKSRRRTSRQERRESGSYADSR